MKSFVWMEDENSDLFDGYYECREHGSKDCSHCCPIPKSDNYWTIKKQPIDLSYKSLLDEVLERYFKEQ